MPRDILWHIIGHLQRNKVKYIVDKVYLIHSVDSLRLAEEISKEAVKKNVCVNILVEVNVANEETKFGTTCEEVKQLVQDIAKLPNICVKGLMTIAPFVENAEKNRPFFSNLKKISVDIMEENIDNITMEIPLNQVPGRYVCQSRNRYLRSEAVYAVEKGKTMGVMDKFLDALHLNNEEEYYDDDDFYDEGEIIDNTVRKPMRVVREEEDFDEPVEKPRKQSQKVTPIRAVKRAPGNGMEVCVIRPNSIEDAREITETGLLC